MAAERLEAVRAQLDREAKANWHSAPRVLEGFNFADMKPHLTDNYLVKGLINTNSTVGLIGATGCGKTFLVTDLAVHIAASQPWRGMAVRGGLVVFAALEGPVSAINRFVACREAKNFGAGLPLRLTPGPINLRLSEDRQLLVNFIRQAEHEHGISCAAVFIDTLARAMAGGDENGSEDMGALIAGSDHVRTATSACMILTHHLGKDQNRGARGHSSFKAALDTEIELVDEGESRVATVTKQRDLPSGGRFAFRLKTVELGRDSDGDAVQTCIIESAEVPPPTKKAPTNDNIRLALAHLVSLGRPIITLGNVREELKEVIPSKQRRADTITWLQKNQYLIPTVGGLRLES